MLLKETQTLCENEYFFYYTLWVNTCCISSKRFLDKHISSGSYLVQAFWASKFFGSFIKLLLSISRISEVKSTIQDEKKSGLDEKFLIEFIKMEIKQKQISRADTLFKFSL